MLFLRSKKYVKQKVLENYGKKGINNLNKNGFSPIQQAVVDNNVTAMKVLMNERCHFRILNDYGENLLFLAIRYGSFDAFKFLLPIININQEDNIGNTLLMQSITEGTIQHVKKILKCSININARNNLDDTALITAIKLKKEKIAILLIKSGAGVNLVNLEGDTALTIASGLGLYPVVKELVNYNTDLNTQNNNGDTALLKCVKEETSCLICSTILTLEVEHIFIPAMLKTLKRLRNTYLKILTLLIEKGCNIHIINSDNMNALLLAKNIENDNAHVILKKYHN